MVTPPDHPEDAGKKSPDPALRSCLINYRPAKTRLIKIVDEDPRELYDILVLKGRAMRFLPAKEPSPDPGKKVIVTSPRFTITEEDITAGSPLLSGTRPGDRAGGRHTDPFLQTELDQESLQKRLLSLYEESAPVHEEQGPAVLWLALGFLEWYESPSSQKPAKAPLILIPLGIRREGDPASYRIEWTNEDPVGNIPLKEKLGEQGINLPDFDMPEEKWGIDEYFRETVKAVKKFPAWKVLIDIQIAVLRPEREKKETAPAAEKEGVTGQRDARRKKRAVIMEEATAPAGEEKRQRPCAEKDPGETVCAKDRELQALRSEHARLREELDAQKTELAHVVREREAAQRPRKDLEELLAAAVPGREEPDNLARAIPPGGRREEPRAARPKDDDHALDLLREQEQICRKLGNKEGLARSLGSQALICRDRGEPDRAMELFNEQEQICRKLGNNDELQRSLENQALIHRDLGEPDRAVELFREQEQICRENRNKDGLQRSLGNQALIHRDLGEPDRAMELHKEEERICREIRNKDGLQRSLGNQALIHRDLGEPDRAMELHREKERICREIGNKKGIVLSLTNQAGIFLYERQDPGEALPLLEEAYQIAVSSGFESLVRQLRMYLDKVQKLNEIR
ncbi:DUF4011 domain-containing protein [Methanoregula sp.]|uniref:DUF4011 domain-containing protein n=1 Tax=Methanoregula sp. TaxID=2052170 RepID=UPI003BB04A34